MKSPLSATEQESLRMKNILKTNEIAYKEDNKIFAEDALTGEKRIISVSQSISEAKSFLFG
jgi:hypothetical protein